MPPAPRKPCRKQGCPELTTGRFCDAHRKEYKANIDKRRGTSAERGYDADWRRMRQWYIARNPVCVECKKAGRVVPAKEIDHITPIAQGGARLDENNLQSLCKSHHSQKTARETFHGY